MHTSASLATCIRSHPAARNLPAARVESLVDERTTNVQRVRQLRAIARSKRIRRPQYA